MIETVKDRLVSFLKYSHITRKAFGDKVGVSAAYVNNIRNSIQPKTLNKISVAYPDLNIAWLLTGQGDMIVDPSQKVEANGHHIGTSQFGDVNFIEHNDLSKDEQIEALQKQLQEKNERISELQAQIRDKEKIISLLEKSAQI